MKKKILKISLITISVVTLCFILLSILPLSGLMIYKKNLKISYKEFVKTSEVLCETPGLDTEFVPQAISYNEKHQVFVVAGYNSDDSASPIYLFKIDGSLKKKITVKLESGEYYTGHAGGVISFGDIIFVSSGSKVHKLDMNKALGVNDGESIVVDASTKVDVSGATMFVYDNCLFVTEFYQEKNYQTDLSHHITTPSGEVNKALAFAYEIDEASVSGLKSNEPIMVVSIPEKVQGVIVKDNKIILSTSYGRYNDSYIREYNNVLNKETNLTYDYNGDKLPLYVICNDDKIKDLLAPPMSEGMCVYNEELVVLFESGAKKYRATTRCKTNDIWIVKNMLK